MKKILLTLIAAALVISMAACTNTNTNKENPNENDENNSEIENNDQENNDENSDAENNNDENANTNETDGNNDSADNSSATIGTTLLNIFKENVADAESAEALATTITDEADLPLTNMMVTAVEAGYLSGFGNAEISGFDEGAMFSPMIGAIPFVGYIFVLPDDADVDAFKTTLSDNADLRWNICVEADEMVVDNVGNTVFFVMCRNSEE